MTRTPQFSIGKTFALSVLALVAGLRPVWGAPLPIGSPGQAHKVGQALEVSACCVEPEPGSCCPADEDSQSGPAFLPACCGVDTPPSEPSQPEPVPRLSVPDATQRVLRELARALQQVYLSTPGCYGQAHAMLDGAGLSPPDPARAARVLAGHWLTDRESLATLALLSIARL